MTWFAQHCAERKGFKKWQDKHVRRVVVKKVERNHGEPMELAGTNVVPATVEAFYTPMTVVVVLNILRTEVEATTTDTQHHAQDKKSRRAINPVATPEMPEMSNEKNVAKRG